MGIIGENRKVRGRKGGEWRKIYSSIQTIQKRKRKKAKIKVFSEWNFIKSRYYIK